MLKWAKKQWSEQQQRNEIRKENAEQERILAENARIEQENQIREKERQQSALRSSILKMVSEGKVPDLGLAISVPFKLQKAEKWLVSTNDVAYSEMKVKREIKGRSVGSSVRVAKGVSVRVGASKGTPVEHDELVYRGSGLFAISTKHVFFSGDRSFRIPHGKIVSVQSVPETGLEIVRDRASAMPEYFGIYGEYAEFIANLIHLLPEVDFGKGEPELEPIDAYYAMMLDDAGDGYVFDQ